MRPRPGAVSGTGRRHGVSAGPRLWLISRPQPPGLPAPWLVDGGRGLPVFSFREEAEAFLRSRRPLSGGWTVRETGPEELLAVLLGPAGAVTKRVLLDPIPGVADRVSSCLVGIGRERFVGRLLEQFRAGRIVRTTVQGRDMDGEYVIVDRAARMLGVGKRAVRGMAPRAGGEEGERHRAPGGLAGLGGAGVIETGKTGSRPGRPTGLLVEIGEERDERESTG